MTFNKNILIGAGLIGASLFVFPSLFNNEESSRGGSTFGGGSTPSVASVGLPSSTGGLDSSTTKKDATISSLPDVNIYESSDLGVTKKATSTSPYTQLTSSSPVGTTYPVYSNGKVLGYEVMTLHGGVSTNNLSAYGGTTTTKKESSTAQPSIISSIGSASGIGSSPIASAVGSFLGRWF